MKKKFLWRIVCALLPLLLLLVGVNVAADPGNVFHGASVNEEMAERLLAGECAYVASGNLEERAVKLAQLLRFPAAFDCVVLGPSLSMDIDSAMVGTECFQNLGVSAATDADICAMLYLLAYREQLPGRIILCLDSMFFDRTQKELDGRSEFFSREYEAALTYFTSGQFTLTPEMHGSLRGGEKLAEALSLPYFQASIAFLAGGGAREGRVGLATAAYAGAYWRPDGSHVYAREFLERSAQEVESGIQSYVWGDLDGQITPYAHLDEASVAAFEALADFCAAEGIELELFLCPYPPQVWEKIQSEEAWSLPRELDAFARQQAQERSLTLIGGYDPAASGCVTEDFNDYRHLRPARLAALFDFTGEAQNG